MSGDGEMISALATENERLSIELAQWKAAAGWSADGFGPQTPDEVAVFQRAGERVNGQIAGLEIAKLRAEVATAKAALEEARAGVRLMLKACDACFDECQGMVRYSTTESDNYWELAEALMELTSKRLGITIQRAPADPGDPNPGV